MYAGDPVCEKCTGANKNKPIKGMTILWGLNKDRDICSADTVLKPSIGKSYTSQARLLEGGRKLEVSGSVSFLCKHQMGHANHPRIEDS